MTAQELLEAGDQLVAYLAQHAQATPRGRDPPRTAWRLVRNLNNDREVKRGRCVGDRDTRWPRPAWLAANRIAGG